MRALGAALATTVLLAAGCAGELPKRGCVGANGGGCEPASVLYAASLVNLMEHDIFPAFDDAIGYHGGSQQLANQVTGHVRRGDVFVSASPAVDERLRQAGALRWWVTFASAPLVLGYDARSRYAEDLRDRPWQEALGEPGIRVGRTDPKLDPKGVLTEQAARQARVSLAGTSVFPEETLVARLQAGQLDAAFLYENEAVERDIPYVPLDPVHLGATYTVGVLDDAPHPDNASAFVRFLLGPKATALLRAHGLTPLPHTAHGDAPSWLRPQDAVSRPTVPLRRTDS